MKNFNYDDNYGFIFRISIYLFCASIPVNAILSLAQLFNKDDYGYKESLLNLANFLKRYNNKECYNLFSEIKSKKKFARVKTIINFLYNLYIILAYINIQNSKGSKICIFFTFVFIFGYIAEFIMTAISLSNFDKFDYIPSTCKDDSFRYTKTTPSKWVIRMDRAIMSFIAFSFPGTLIIFIYILFVNYDSNTCIDENDFCICTSIYNCLKNCCDSSNGCCNDCCCNCQDCCKPFENCCYSCKDCCQDCCNGIERDIKNCCCKCTSNYCDSNIQCCNECCYDCFNCMKNLCKKLKELCKSCGQSCKKCRGDDLNSLQEENNNLKNDVEKLKKEINELEGGKTGDIQLIVNSGNTKDEILVSKSSIDKKKQKEKPLKDELDSLLLKNKNLENEMERLKNKINCNKEESKSIEKGLINKNIEQSQLNVIYFYIRNEVMKKNDFGKYSPKYIFLKKIDKLDLDSEQFKKIGLYYIKSKLIEHLTDSNTKELFLHPIITPEGITYEKINVEQQNNVIENKLVLEICKILKESGKELIFNNYEKIKKLLMSEQTGQLFKNPVVITSGNKIGETVEDINNENTEYKNLIIKNIIKDMNELFLEEFFIFDRTNIFE